MEDAWPSPGARLHHSFGVWPMLINDKTTMIEWEPDRRAVLEAEGWPLGTARVVLTVEPDGPAALPRDAGGGRPSRTGCLMPKPLGQAMIVSGTPRRYVGWRTWPRAARDGEPERRGPRATQDKARCAVPMRGRCW